MIEASSEEILDSSPEEVFDFLADARNEPAWNPDVVTVEQTTPGPVGEGTTRRGDYKHIGEVESTIVTYDRPRRLGFRAVGRQAQITLDFTFEDGPAGGTRMRVHGTLSLKGPLRFAEGALRGPVTQQYVERARAVKRALDGGQA